MRIAGPHVVLLDKPDWNGTDLRIALNAVSVLALGRDCEALFVSVGASDTTAANPEGTSRTTVPAAPTASGNDALFLFALMELGSDLARIGAALMVRIRAIYPGALIPTEKPRRFIETPDNFWGIEVQPRKMMIKLIVRSSQERLRDCGLVYESERPPAYFSMRIQTDHDIEPAMRFLELAERSTDP